MSESQDLFACYRCGWLGLCDISCPLADPAHRIPVTISTAPDLGVADDVPFEIVGEEQAPTDTPPAAEHQAR